MSRLTRVGTAEPVSRGQILRRGRGQGKNISPCSADHDQGWQPYLADPYSATTRVFIYFCISLTADGPQRAWLPIPSTTALPFCLWSRRIFPSLPDDRLTIFYLDVRSALLQLANQFEWLYFTSSRSHAFRYRKKFWFSQDSNSRLPH